MKNRCAPVVVCLVLCLCVFAGCKDKGPIYNEDSKGVTSTTQSSVVNTVQGYYEAADFPYFDPDVPDDREPFKEFLRGIEDAGTGITFEYDTVQASKSGYRVSLMTPLDGWGHSMLLYIETPSADAPEYTVAIVSAGPNNEFDTDGVAEFDTESDVDDIRMTLSFAKTTQ